jgi:hypothetical protein
MLHVIEPETTMLSETLGLKDHILVFEGFTEPDPAVVEAIAEAEDPERMAHACLQIGVRASVAAKATMDSQVVEKAFGELTDEFSVVVNRAAARIVETAEALVDEDGAMPALLRNVQEEVTGKVTALFDPDSKSSVMSVMQEVFEGAATTQSQAMRKAFDPQDAESPLGRWKGEVLTAVKESATLVLGQVTELAASIAAAKAEQQTLSLCTIKGRSFEELLHGLIGGIAARHGDLAEAVGDVRGAAGAKSGDELVTLNLEETGRQHAAVVFEMKHRRLSMRKTLEELDAAMANRDAQAAVAVFASAEAAPTAVPFVPYGRRTIVVIDPDAPDERLLELAFMTARWEARKALGVNTGTIDHSAVEECIAAARQALGRLTTVRTHHSAARRGIELAGTAVDTMVSEVDEALRALREALGQ